MQKKNQSRESRTILFIFVAFFAVFITIDIIYIIISEKTWRGIVTEDGYQKGLKYNQTIAAIKKQNQLGWNLQIKYQSSISKNGILQVKLFNKNNQEIKDAIIIANIKRPVQEGKDFSVDLKFDNKTSSYISEINFPMIGQWDVEIVARRYGDIYQDTKRFVIR